MKNQKEIKKNSFFEVLISSYVYFFTFLEETLCQIQCNYKNRVKNENRRTFEIASFLIFTYDKIQRAGK